VAKELNYVLLKKVRCLLFNTQLDKSFWTEAMVYASHVMNRMPSSAIRGKVPEEFWSGGTTQNYGLLRVFGCPTHLLAHKVTLSNCLEF